MRRSKMEKQTKKMVTLGVSVFAVVSLCSVGAAAFVVTSSASASSGGNAHIGVIQDSKVRFETIDGGQLTDFFKAPDDGLYNQICFDAPKDDNTGRFRYLDDGKHLYEHLKVRIQGNVMPWTYISRVTLQLQTATAYEGYKGNPILDAIEAGYIELYPVNGSTDYINNPVEIDFTKYYADKDAKSFDIKLGFNWGVKFNHVNPSIYYDDTNKGGGASIPDETMREEMKKFTTLLHYGKGFTGPYPTDEKDLPELSFTAILTAEIN
ncbi:MAG: hypothetical protein ACI4QP_00155 [Candidatus Enteromonas sp.]